VLEKTERKHFEKNGKTTDMTVNLSSLMNNELMASKSTNYTQNFLESQNIDFGDSKFDLDDRDVEDKISENLFESISEENLNVLEMNNLREKNFKGKIGLTLQDSVNKVSEIKASIEANKAREHGGIFRRYRNFRRIPYKVLLKHGFNQQSFEQEKEINQELEVISRSLLELSRDLRREIVKAKFSYAGNAKHSSCALQTSLIEASWISIRERKS
jgi:hypothetical protein